MQKIQISRYSIKTEDIIWMKWLDFLFFAKNRGSKYGKKIMNTSTQQAARPGAKKLEEKKYT